MPVLCYPLTSHFQDLESDRFLSILAQAASNIKKTAHQFSFLIYKWEDAIRINGDRIPQARTLGQAYSSPPQEAGLQGQDSTASI